MDEAATAEVERIKSQLKLVPHPTGYGAYREVFKADRQTIFVTSTKHSGPRSSGTSIYFLLPRPHCVQWHKHLSDEGFYWHAGGPVKIHMLTEDGELSTTTLGDVTRHAHCAAQVVVPHDTWYAAELETDTQYALYSAVVMPGFEYEDWQGGEREAMLKQFPQHTDIIIRLT